MFYKFAANTELVNTEPLILGEIQGYCYINEPKTASVYWPLGCLFFHSRLGPISLKACWHRALVYSVRARTRGPSVTLFSLSWEGMWWVAQIFHCSAHVHKSTASTDLAVTYKFWRVDKFTNTMLFICKEYQLYQSSLILPLHDKLAG